MPIQLESTTMADVAKLHLGINSMVLEIESLRQMVAHKDAETKKLKEENAKLQTANANVKKHNTELASKLDKAQKGKASVPK